MAKEPGEQKDALVLTGQEWSDLADVVSDYWNKTDWVENDIWLHAYQEPGRVETIKRRRALCARIIKAA